MAIRRRGSAQWSGGLKDGKGLVSTASGALKELPYGFKMRFEDQPGTNPEELIGAAHAACFSMALSGIIEGAGFTVENLATTATVSMEKIGDGFTITGIELELKGRVPGVDEAKFIELAEKAKAGCPVSRALGAVPITLKASLG